MPTRNEKQAGSDPVATLGVSLRELQRQIGKSLKDLESEVHVSDSSLSRYLAGHARPPWSVVERLSVLAGRDAEALRPVWERAGRARQPADGGGDESVLDGPRSADRRRRLKLAAAFAATALVFGAGGVLVGRQFGVQIVTIKPTEDSACRDWPWPANPGDAVQPPVRPQAPDHAPTVELMAGKASDGRNAVWARITNAAFGDRVWLDMSTDGARSWTQCGPFPVTTTTGTSRAHDTMPNVLFRACGDVPTPAPNARGEICTNW
jgi:transcriptional regulator with XRE-family HTH domain